MIEVIEVTSPGNLGDFIKLPRSLYSKDPFYVPPLTSEIKKQFSDKNPFFLHATARYFLAKMEGKAVGRIASVINRRHIEFHNEKTGFFGFFESTDNRAVASALLDKVAETLREADMETMRGPMNFSTNEECGFLTEGFNSPPMIMTPYNPSFYNDLMGCHGMAKSKDLYAYILDVPEELPKKILRVADIAARSGLRVRPVNKKNFDY